MTKDIEYKSWLKIGQDGKGVSNRFCQYFYLILKGEIFLRNKHLYFIAILIIFTLCAAGCGDNNPVTFNSPTGVTGATGATGPVDAVTLTINVIPADAQTTVTLNRVLSIAEDEEIEGTDSINNGTFIFNNLFPGTYVLVCEAPGYAIHTENITLAEDTAVSVNLTETQIGSLTGIEPRVILNSDLTTLDLNIKGSGFSGTAEVTLTPAAGGNSIGPVIGNVVDSETITCTFDLNYAASGEYVLTVTHFPLTSSSTDATSTLFLMNTIQDVINKASDLYLSENSQTQIIGYIPAGTYNYMDPELPVIPLLLRTGVYLKGDGSANTNIVASGGTNQDLFCSRKWLNFTLEGFTLDGQGTADQAFYVTECENITINANIITGFTGNGAIEIDNNNVTPGDSYITNNTFNNCADNTLYLDYNPDAPSPGTLNITGNIMTNTETGIYVVNVILGTVINFERNTLTNITGGSDEILWFNAVSSGGSVNISENIISNNNSARIVSISGLGTGGIATIEGNEISGNTDSVDDSVNSIIKIGMASNGDFSIKNNLIKDNTCNFGNGGGIYIDSGF